MAIANVTAGALIDPDWGNAVADVLNQNQFVQGSTNVSGIAATPVNLSAANDTLTVIDGQTYEVGLIIPIRFGAAATATVTGELRADGTGICNAIHYDSITSNKRFALVGAALWTASSSSVAFKLYADTSSGTMQTYESTTRPYSYWLRPLG